MAVRGATILALALGAAFAPLGCGARAAAPRPVPERSERSVLSPQRFGWVSTLGDSGALPSAIALGGKTSGSVLVYLEFPELVPGRRLLRAELWLDLARRPVAPIELELTRSDDAGARLERWSDQPRARYPRVVAALTGERWGSPLDVSELLRAPAEPGEPVRILVRAEPEALEAALLQTGAAGGRAPRLELYWE
jgi:hypothetical protein